jgi:hypothetical protein
MRTHKAFIIIVVIILSSFSYLYMKAIFIKKSPEQVSLEYIYLSLGSKIASPELCSKMSGGIERVPFEIYSSRLEDSKSDCFFAVATEKMDKSFCQYVRTKKELGRKLNLDGTREQCLEITTTEGRQPQKEVSFYLSFDWPDQRLLLEKMGFDHKKIRSLTMPDQTDNSLFYAFTKTEEFKSRIPLLPDYSK